MGLDLIGGNKNVKQGSNLKYQSTEANWSFSSQSLCDILQKLEVYNLTTSKMELTVKL